MLLCHPEGNEGSVNESCRGIRKAFIQAEVLALTPKPAGLITSSEAITPLSPKKKKKLCLKQNTSPSKGHG